MRPGSILMAVYVPGGFDENDHRQLAFDIGIGALHLFDGLGSHSVPSSIEILR